ncbi:MAG: hypothetical protein Kow00117_08440 [Phototrophicales bacterium]
MFNWMIPYANYLQHHPVYFFETHTKRHRRTLQMMTRTSLIWFYYIFMLMIAAWLFVIWRDTRSASTFTFDDMLYIASQQTLTWFFLIGVAASLLIDIIAILASVGSINRQRTSGHWDLLQLTTLDERTIIHTKHVIIQLQAWRMFVVVLSIRLTTILLFLIQSLFFAHGDDPQTVVQSFLDYFSYDFPNAALTLAIVVNLGMFYLLEPFWRLRAMTALGMWISARVNRVTSALISGFAMIILVWLSHSFGLYALYWLMRWTAEMIDFSYVTLTKALLFLLFWLLVCISVLYLYYWFLRRFSLQRATEHAFNPT